MKDVTGPRGPLACYKGLYQIHSNESPLCSLRIFIRTSTNMQCSLLSSGNSTFTTSVTHFCSRHNWKLPAASSSITCSQHSADLQSLDHSTFCCSNSCEQGCNRDENQVDQMFVVRRMFLQCQIRVAQIVSYPVNLRLNLTKNLAKQVFIGWWGIIPSILNLWTRYRYVARFKARLFHPSGKGVLYTLNGRLGGP